MMTIMGLFSDDGDRDGDPAELAAEAERIESMALPALAAEVMERAWGHGGPGDAYAKSQDETALDPNDVTAMFGAGVSASSDAAIAIRQAVEEALQVLEHAGLVVYRVGGSDFVRAEFRPSRAGLRALDAGEVGARLAG